MSALEQLFLMQVKASGNLLNECTTALIKIFLKIMIH